METPAFSSGMILAILPEIGLIVLAGLVLMVDLLFRHKRERDLGLLTFGGLLLVAGLTLVFTRPGIVPELVFGGMLRLHLVTWPFVSTAVTNPQLSRLETR